MARHKIRITRSRKPASSLDYTAQEMARIGEAGNSSMYNRIRLGVDIYDRAAPPLKGKRYPRFKVSRYGAKPIRDWWRSGQTLRAMKVIQASVNRVVIGFTTTVANQRASLNNWRWQQFGLSSRDLQAVSRAIREVKQQRQQAA